MVLPEAPQVWRREAGGAAGLQAVRGQIVPSAKEALAQSPSLAWAPPQASALHFILFFLKREGLKIGKTLKFHRTLDLVLIPSKLGATTQLAGGWEKQVN